MMPTIVRDDGFKVVIFTNDHAPAHVHVLKAGGAIKVDLLTLHAFDVKGEISNREITRAEDLVRQHADRLQREGGNCMEPVLVTEADRKRYARARAAGREAEAAPSALVRAWYDTRRDAIDLQFQCGVTITIPRALIAEFDGASRRDLRAIERITPEALGCEPLDVHIFVPGLVESVLGSRFFAAATGRRGGKRRSKVKAAAARMNGALGGRPRKRRTT